jgi:hypothetical protein
MTSQKPVGRRLSADKVNTTQTYVAPSERQIQPHNRAFPAVAGKAPKPLDLHSRFLVNEYLHKIDHRYQVLECDEWQKPDEYHLMQHLMNYIHWLENGLSPEISNMAANYPDQPALVIHYDDAPPGWEDDPLYVYIGRANGRKKLKQSIWRNPYKIDVDGSREEVIRKYREEHLPKHPELLSKTQELRGKVLVCWCKRLGSDTACHGDVLVDLLRERA